MLNAAVIWESYYSPPRSWSRAEPGWGPENLDFFCSKGRRLSYCFFIFHVKICAVCLSRYRWYMLAVQTLACIKGSQMWTGRPIRNNATGTLTPWKGEQCLTNPVIRITFEDLRVFANFKTARTGKINDHWEKCFPLFQTNDYMLHLHVKVCSIQLFIQEPKKFARNINFNSLSISLFFCFGFCFLFV